MDHQEDAEAEEMEARERELLSRHYGEVRPEAWASREEAGGDAAIASGGQTGTAAQDGPATL
jgi:hypothetical protein